MKSLTFEEAKNITFTLDEVCKLVKLATAFKISTNSNLLKIGLDLILKDKYHLYIETKIRDAIIDEMLGVNPDIRDILYAISQERQKERK